MYSNALMQSVNMYSTTLNHNIGSFNTAAFVSMKQPSYQSQIHQQHWASSTNNLTSHHPPVVQQSLTYVPFSSSTEAGAATGGGYTVQDHPYKTPVYNGVNPHYPNLQMIHLNPPIFAVPDFLTPTECDFLICIAQDCFTPAPVVGKGTGELTSSRTSSTCYLAREDLPEYMNKISLLTGKPVEHCELPQVGRYFPSQQYLQHFDAFDLSNQDGVRFASNGGQRTVTVLTYLNDVERGGHTAFPTLNLEIQPKKGMALVFFPATVDGLLDKNALHAARPAVDTKYVSQVWIRQGPYDGVPSKRMFTSPEQASMVQKSLIFAREGSNGFSSMT